MKDEPAEGRISAVEAPDPHGVSQPVNWKDYRDHLATADQQGRRRWLYPKKPSGTWHTRRAWFAAVLIVVMFAGPWIRIQGNPLLMINIVERKFSILGQMFWPQDSILFAVAMLVFITGIIVFTTAFGRLWCGWACPQTIMMEMVFRKLEYLIDGDSAEQKSLSDAPWTARKIARRLFKHAVFFGVSFIVGNTLFAYIVGSDQLLRIQLDDPRNHVTGLTFMILFSLLFYAIFARFREQACTFICPYGRFQSAALDENTMLVMYDRKRGESRAPWRKGESVSERAAQGHGDCVNCRQCVAVCPTGIDIRDGTQMECVNCTACIDACDQIMDRVGRPHGLIRFASQNSVEKGEPQRFTKRMLMYAVVLGALVTLFLTLVLTRAPVETTFLRAQGALYQPGPDGTIGNVYSVKVINKAHHDIPVEFVLEGVEGKIRVMGANPLVAPKESFVQTSVMVYLPKSVLTGSATRIKVGVFSGGKRLEALGTTFAGPRNDE